MGKPEKPDEFPPPANNPEIIPPIEPERPMPGKIPEINPVKEPENPEPPKEVPPPPEKP